MAMCAPAGAAPDAYERALARIPELEVDLASACSALERAQSDNIAMREIHTDLVAAYKRLQDQHDRCRQQLRQEQEERQELFHEQNQQVALWRAQLEAKAREFDELQARHVPPREVEAMRMTLAEENEQLWVQRERELEQRLGGEARRAMELQRHLEQQRGEFVHREDELHEEAAEQARRMKLREEALERQVSELQSKLHRQAEADSAAARVRATVNDLEVKVTSLQQALREKEEHSERERKTSADELQTRVDEVSKCRRRVLELQALVDAEERKCDKLAQDAETARREQVQAMAQLNQAEAKAAAAAAMPSPEVERLRAEVAQLKSAAAMEREKHAAALKAAGEQRQAASEAQRKAEAQVRHAAEEQKERESAAQAEHSEAERRLNSEITTLKGQLDAAEKKGEDLQRATREREKKLQQQLDAANISVENANDELMKSQDAQDDLGQRLEQVRQEYQKRLGEWQAQERSHEASVVQLEKARADLEDKLHKAQTATEGIRVDLRLKDQRCNELEAGLAEMSTRMDTERAKSTREAEEARASSAAAAEKQHTTAMQRLYEEHKRKLAKLQAASKQALMKGAKKRQELRVKCQDVAKRVMQLQQEKATAIRICEENKSTYEVRVAELTATVGMASRLGSLSASFPAGLSGELAPSIGGYSPMASLSIQRGRELRAIAERLEKHAVRTSRAESPVDNGKGGKGV